MPLPIAALAPPSKYYQEAEAPLLFSITIIHQQYYPMPLFILDHQLVFPDTGLAEPDGLLAIGGDLSPDRLLLAYRNGIFPWYEGEAILWWFPDPRFVLFPGELAVSKSMKQLLRKNTFEFTINRDFDGVIRNCKTIARDGQDGTWITDAMQQAFTRLHGMGYAQSAETWLNGELVGGLYGIRLGSVFFGESMFSRVSNASKFAFIKYIVHLRMEGLRLVDCQVYTDHLASLGARMIDGKDFSELLRQYS